MATLENANIFKDRTNCTQDDVLRCPSVVRMEAILKCFNTIAIDSSKESKKVSVLTVQSIQDIFSKNQYEYTHLLDDFHHIRYNHHIDDNGDTFHQLHAHCFDDLVCDVQTCGHIQRYWRDRTDQSEDADQTFFSANDIVDTDDRLRMMCVMDLIEQIHVYFIHSYDINRLTTKEIQIIDDQIQLRRDAALDDDLADIDLYDDQKVEKVASILAEKSRKLDITRNDDRFITKPIAPKRCVIDSDAIHRLLQAEGISMDPHATTLQDVLKKYDNNKPLFISDMISTYYRQSGDITGNIDLSREVCGCILYKYIKKDELNNAQFIQISKIIIESFYPHIADNIERFVEIARNAKTNISGKILIRGNNEFMNSVKFAKVFTKMPNYSRKDFSTIYVKINQWKPLNLEANQTPKQMESEDEKDEAKDESEEDENETEKKKIGVYQLGMQFLFWEIYRYHEHYISANHDNFKDEMVNNKRFSFEMRWWDKLNVQCVAISRSIVFKSIRSKGYHQSIYGVKRDSELTTEHLMALKLYTDYSTLCRTFCAILRVADGRKVAEIAHWAKLLTECVQCYGESMKSSNAKSYYRGVEDVFYFEMFVARFKLPTSTTTDISIAIGKFSGGGAGFVMEFREYMDTYDVTKFDCDGFSAFPEEKESLFFGGDTVLRIRSIRHIVDRQWTNYKKYIEPLNAIFRMINGLPIVKQPILTNKKYQRTMIKLFRYMLCTYTSAIDPMNNQTTTVSLRPYIEKILKHNVFNCEMQLRYNELLNQYAWLQSIFTTFANNQTVLNLANICAFYCNSNKITFLMDADYILSDFECRCIVDSLDIISNMNVIVVICFKWPSNNIPMASKSNINEYFREILQAKWSRSFQKHTLTFECTEPSLTDAGQNIFVKTINGMLSLLVPVQKKDSKPSHTDIKSQTLPVIRVTKKHVSKRHLLTVSWFIREILTSSVIYASPDVFDLLLLLYAKPLIMNIKYDNQVKYILFDPVNDEWDSTRLKILSVFSLSNADYTCNCLGYKNGRVITHTDFDDCRWDEKDIFEADIKRRISFCDENFARFANRNLWKIVNRIWKVIAGDKNYI
eukprot:536109_1